MSGFEICIPKESLEILHEHYSGIKEEDKLCMKERIEQRLSLYNQVELKKDSSSSHQQVDTSHHSTTESNPLPIPISKERRECEVEESIMSRADVLFKYILRSFRKHYCKSF